MDGRVAGTTNQSTVHVIATTLEGTLAALVAAIPLAKGSRARVLVLAPQVVPFPPRVGARADDTTSGVDAYRHLVAELDDEARFRHVVCQAADDVVRMLPSEATVVVGGQVGRWRATPEERLARELTRLGHHVIFAIRRHSDRQVAR